MTGADPRALYRFHSVWELPFPRDLVVDVLADLGTYPAWWREVRAIRPVGDDAAELTCRSALPYDLTFVTTSSRRSPADGILEARLTGDLEGFSRWTIASGVTPAGLPVTTAVFDEEVVANTSLLRRLTWCGRPVFRANHAIMMRHGHQGLRIYLAGVAWNPSAGTSRAVP